MYSLVSWTPKPKPPKPPPTRAAGTKPKPTPKGGIVVSDETLRRLLEKKGRIFPGPKEPVKSA